MYRWFVALCDLAARYLGTLKLDLHKRWVPLFTDIHTSTLDLIFLGARWYCTHTHIHRHFNA